MEKRGLGRIGRSNGVLVFGGAALSEVAEEEAADHAISLALDAGIDHFDTAAAGYGDSELHYGRWMGEMGAGSSSPQRPTNARRTPPGARFESSLERLRVDGVDLVQLHAVGDLDRATYRDGSLHAAVEARDEGLARAPSASPATRRPPRTSKPSAATRSTP